MTAIYCAGPSDGRSDLVTSRLGRGLLLAFALAGVAPAAGGAERPFLATNSAAAEEDNDRVWSIESTLQRLGPTRGATLAAEYAFDPTTSLQLEIGHARDRSADASASNAEIEFKQLFNHIAREGWGWGVAAGLGLAKATGSGWRRDALRINAAWTLSLWQGDGALHLNAGVTKPGDGRHAWTASAALEREIVRRTTGFIEWAREADVKLIHCGVRHWIRRDRLALDISLQRTRDPDAQASGFVIGLGWYDL